MVMRFSRDFLADMDGETIEDEIIGHGRWTVHHRRVFSHEGKFYVTTYSVGATESQDERPYEYDSEEIDCAEVFPREKTITVYE
jgi:hypothetical protein